jgi:hypothetical protein
MAPALRIVHGLLAVALLGAITHQALSAWAPSDARPASFFGRFRTIPAASFANAIVGLYMIVALLGVLVYLHFKSARFAAPCAPQDIRASSRASRRSCSVSP